jgi:uncharacterized damage-inducible protein DinB
MTVKELVLEHLAYTFEKEAWQPPLGKAIDGLNAQQAAWKPAPERHSIWQIVRHVTHWKKSVLQALDGKTLDYKDLERTDWREATGDDAAWDADVKALHEVTGALDERVRSSDDEGLAELMPTYVGLSSAPKASRLVRMATHDIYHSGQIRYIRALQGV